MRLSDSSPSRARPRALSRILIAAALSLGLAPAMARAQSGLIDQVWIGGFAHDVSDIGHGKESDSGDVQLEVDSARPALLRALGAPRLNATLSLNSAGLTNFASVGLVWDHRLFRQLYGTLDLGMGLTDGVSEPPAPSQDGARRSRLLLGSKDLFREALGLEWRLSDRWSIGGEFVHLSNGLILAKHYNEGINDAGLRLGYRFR